MKGKKMKNKNKKVFKCYRCGEILNPIKMKCLELSNSDGNFYVEIPKGHISQGGFNFGTKCATILICETIKNLNERI